LTLAMERVDIVFSCAAMKQIPACEDNPIQATQTNIIGSQNVILAAQKTKPLKVMNISTDKCVHPSNLYGATKMCGEKLFTHASVYTGGRQPYFASCRYGNVLASRGSIIPLFREQIAQNKPITITHPSMTRFWISLEKVAQFLLDRVQEIKGGEIYVPKMPSTTVLNIAKALKHDIEFNIIGLRKGEKMHEELIGIEEGYYTLINKDYYIITNKNRMAPTFSYNSQNNPLFLKLEETKKMIESI